MTCYPMSPGRARGLRRMKNPVRLRGLARCTHDAGMATAEYAIATLAACGFAALLLTLMTSGEVRSLLFGIVKRALTVG